MISISSRGGGGAVPYLAGGRLTVDPALSVPTADLSGQSTLYYLPHEHGQIATYSSSAGWALRSFGLAVALGLTGLTSGKLYDVGLVADLTMKLGTAWTNDTTRALGLIQRDGNLMLEDGTSVYLGTIRATGATTTADTKAKRYVYNWRNRVRRPLQRFEATDNWTYSTAAYQQANADAANQVELVQGFFGSAIDLRATGLFSCDLVNGYSSVAIGEDSVTTPASSDSTIGFGLVKTVDEFAQITATLTKMVATIGWHRYVWLERGNGATTTTWYSRDAVPARQSGLVGTVDL